MAAPQYSYDPVTQRYTLIDPMAPVQPTNQGLGALYNAGDGGADSMAPSSYGSNFSLSPMATEFGVGAQNLGNAIATNPVSSFSPTVGAVGAVSSAIGNSIMGTQVSPVANPTAPTETAIASLASMNSQTQAQNEAQSQAQGVASVAESVASDVAGFADSTDAEAGAANAAAAAAAAGVSDSGGGGDASGNGSGDSPSGPDGGPDGDSTNAGDSSDDSYYRGGRVMNYQQGGVASLAQKVQSEGRGQDKMLVHMTPKEVAGLQYLAMRHGGSLTINPRTGLVEAGFLSSILPMVAGAALNIAVPGLGAAMGGFAIPALVGSASYLMNPKQGLMGGLMAGLGAYGGANLAGGLVGAESIGAQNMAAQGGYDELIKQGFMDQSGNLLNPATGAAYLPAELAPGVANPAAAAQTAQLAYNPAMSAATQGGMEVGKQQFMQQSVMDRLGQSASAIANQPYQQTLTQLGGPMKAASMVAPLAGAALSGGKEDEGGKAPYEAKIRPFTYDPGRKTEDPGFKYRTGERGESTAEQTYFAPRFTPLGVYKPGEEPTYGTYAGGGITALKHGGMEEGGYVVAADVVSHLGNGSTKAGQELLARKMGGVPLNGKGDGMSDSIPTHIEGKQRARVADGEVYIPASIAKGRAKDLDRMMKRIRKAKTGRSSQAPEMNTSKFVPA